MPDIHRPRRVAMSSPHPTPRPTERRTATRHISVFRVGKVRTPRGEELCLIRNISSGGLMAHLYCSLSLGDRVDIELKGGSPLKGKVVWTGDRVAGFQFDRPVDVLQLLAREQERDMRSAVLREPRLSLSLPIRLRTQESEHQAELCDISQGGARIADGGFGLIGDEVILTLDGLSAVRGQIRWRRKGRLGIVFDMLIPFESLARWAAAQNERMHMAGEG
jgi:translation initiation factor IF-1